jgi:hypothetical protein
LDRREFIRGASALAASTLLLDGRRAEAVGEKSRFSPSALVYNGSWNPRPTALRRLMFEVGRRTAIASAFEPAQTELKAKTLFEQPFLYWSGSSAFPPFDETEVIRLRRFVAAGGFVLVDNAQESGGEFIRDVKRETARAFPSLSIAALQEGHTIYKSFYMLRGAVGRLSRSSRFEALSLDDRAAVVFSENDMGGAWARDSLGNWEFMVPGGEGQRELAFRLGVNVVMYSMCIDYKDDQVHLPFILKRRKM